MKYIIFILFSILCLLNIFDIYSTNILLSNGAEELNPFVKHTIDITGSLVGAVILKGIFLTILLRGCFIYCKNKVFLASLGVLVSYYLIVMTYFNLCQLVNL